MLQGIHATKTHSTNNNISLLDDGLSLAASLLPMKDDIIEKFVRDVLVEEVNQSNRPLIPNSVKQFNAIDQQMPAKVQEHVDNALVEQCDEIVDSLLARFLIESVMKSMQSAF